MVNKLLNYMTQIVKEHSKWNGAAMTSIINGKDKNELLTDFITDYQPPNKADHEIRKLAVYVRCVEDIENSIGNLEISMNKNAESSNNLAQKVFYLNIILTVATVLGTLFAIIKFFSN